MVMNMSEILEFFKSNSELTTFYTISILLSVSANICITVAVAIDCRINHIKHYVIWPLIVFFTYYGALIYLIFRNKFKQKVSMVCSECKRKAPKKGRECKHCGCMHFSPKTYENRGRLNRIIIALIVSSFVLFAGNYIFTNYSPMADEVYEAESDFEASDLLDDVVNNYDEIRYGYEVNGKIVYYDAKGNEYNNSKDVILYSKDGNTYTYNKVSGYVNTKDEEDVISLESALIDSNGYIVDASAAFEAIPEVLPFKTTDGKMYYKAEDVSWNADGKMVYTNNGKDIIN